MNICPSCLQKIKEGIISDPIIALETPKIEETHKEPLPPQTPLESKPDAPQSIVATKSISFWQYLINLIINLWKQK